MRYLQQVIAWIENRSIVTELEELGCRLQKEGIVFWCFPIVQIEEDFLKAGHENIVTGKSVHGNMKTDGVEAASMKTDGVEAASMETDGVEEKQFSRLWITDNSFRASALRMEGEAVLALLHEENRNQNFSGILYACEQPGELDADYLEQVYRRFAGLPWDVAETDRCIIRETTEADVDAFVKIYANPEITRFTENLYPTVEEEKQYIREYREKIYGFYGFGVWTIVKKDTGEIIGRAGFSYREGFEEPEIGFIIGVPWQRQGYALEVCRALLRYGEERLGFSCVQAFVMPENAASICLCERLGLHKAGLEEIEGALYQRYLLKNEKSI